MRMSGNMKRFTALVLTVLLVALLLAGCSSKRCVSCGRSFRSGGYKTGTGYVCDDCYQMSGAVMGSTQRSTSSGVWVAIVVMVFVVVLAATSGVVYIVLRQKLEQEKPAPRRSQPRPPVRRSQPQPPDRRSEPPRAAPRQSPSAPAQQGSFWVCPNDRSRNTGRFCVACGAPRPAVTPPRNVGNPASSRTNPTRPANPAARPQPSSPVYNRPQAAPAAPKYREPENPIFDFDEAVVEPVRNPVKPEPAVRPQPAAAPAQPKMPARPPVIPEEAFNAPQSGVVPIIPEKPVVTPAAPVAPVISAPTVQTQKNPPIPEKPAAPVTPPPAVPAKKGFRTAYVRPAEPAGQEETDLLSEMMKSGQESE